MTVSRFNPVHLRDDTQLEQIQHSVVTGNLEQLTLQLSSTAANWKSRDSNLLHLAIKSKQIRIIEYLLQQGFSPNQSIVFEGSEQPAICLATSLNFCHSVNALLRFGAKTDVADSQMMTPLHLAA